jgi:PAS domain S-box-containing protein
MEKRWSRRLSWAAGLASLLAVAAWILRDPPLAGIWPSILVAAGLIAILTTFRFSLGDLEVNLAHAVSLTLALSLSPPAAGAALTLGMALGELLRPTHAPAAHRSARARLRSWSLEFSAQALSLLGSMLVYQSLGGFSLGTGQPLPSPFPIIGLGVTFPMLYLATLWATRFLQARHPLSLRDTLILVMAAILPIPYAIAGALVSPILGPIGLLVFGGAIAILSFLLRTLVIAQEDLNRRLQELTTLSEVSQAMRTSLDLDSLLTTLYLQVAHLLQVDSFYVALHDPEQNAIHYPFAVKDGKRVQWPARASSDRLTERVIQEGKPILIPRGGEKVIASMGLPDQERPPEAWLGVPLARPERILGCMAAFHTRPGHSLGEKDLQILVTLSGQAAAAIENALLYDQQRKRVQALDSLHQISTTLSATLDPEKALELVSKSMVQVVGGQKSAIYLIEPHRNQLFLARATNLSDGFIQNELIIPLDDEAISSALKGSTPRLISDIDQSEEIDEQRRQSLRAEGIQAMGEVPLTTPSGPIGLAIVYFSEPQRFTRDQIELLKTFAAHAGLAVANARMHAETDQALRQQLDQLSTLEAIGRELASTLNPEELARILLHHAMRMTKTSTGYIMLLEPGREAFRVVAQQGCAPDSPAADGDALHPLDRAPFSPCLESGLPLNIPDTSRAHDFQDWSGTQPGSRLMMPILHKGSPLGAIALEHAQLGHFWPEHERFLSQLIYQAATALSNALLYRQLQTRLYEQSLLFQSGMRIALTLDDQSVAWAAVESIANALEADQVTLFRWSPSEDTLIPIAATDDAPVLGKSLSAGQVPALAEALHKHQPVQRTRGDSAHPADEAYLDKRKQHTLLALPLVAAEEALGVIEILCAEERQFDEDGVRIARTIANQVAIALQNTDLFRQTRQSHERLLAVLNSTHEAMLMASPEGLILMANRRMAQLVEVPEDQLAGRRITDPDLQLERRLGFGEGELEERAERIAQGLLPPRDVVTVRAPGDLVLERSEAGVRDSQGNLIGWLVALRDVTHEFMVNEAREQLMQMIVHDLRSPLTAILNSLRVMQTRVEAVKEDSLWQQAARIAERSCQQMLGLVSSLLEVAKLESGEFALQVEEVDLREVVDETLTIFMHEATEAGVLFDIQLPEDALVIQGDREKLQRTVSNLLDNALKYTPTGGQIGVSLEAGQAAARLEVADTGPGIPIEFRERIFERFAQIPAQEARRRGSGLGLAFARLAVEAHGGRIWVEDNPGGGALFVVELPYQAMSGES